MEQSTYDRGRRDAGKGCFGEKGCREEGSFSFPFLFLSSSSWGAALGQLLFLKPPKHSFLRLKKQNQIRCEKSELFSKLCNGKKM